MFDKGGRSIHPGIDLFTGKGTEILAPLNGKIHSFQDNNNFGDYGSTIILEHLEKGIKFYTLSKISKSVAKTRNLFFAPRYMMIRGS